MIDYNAHPGVLVISKTNAAMIEAAAEICMGSQQNGQPPSISFFESNTSKSIKRRMGEEFLFIRDLNKLQQEGQAHGTFLKKLQKLQ